MATVRTDAFQLPLPAGWSDRTAVTIVAPAAADGSVPNLVITREALCDGMGLAGFADGHGHLMRDQVDGFELLSNGWETLDGRRALVRIVRFQIADSDWFVQLQAFLVHDGLGYAICGTATESAFPTAEAVFRETLDGMRFAGPAERAASPLEVVRG